MKDTKIRVNEDFLNDKIQIFVKEYTDRDVTNINYDSETELLKGTTVEQSFMFPNDTKPFLTLDSRFFKKMVAAIQEYANAKNILSENENITKGKLAISDERVKYLEAQLTKYIDKSTR